jgi:hypothetical protein
VYALFLMFSRPYDDTIFQTYEIITSTGQLALMIVIILGYLRWIEAPQGAFIGIIAFILMGQIGNQVRSEMGRDCSSARLFVLKIVRGRLCVALTHTPTVRQPHSAAAARTRPRENHDGARTLAQASCAHPCVPSCAGKYSGPPRKVRRVLPLGHTLSAG